MDHIIRTQDFDEEFLNRIFYGATKASHEPFWLENDCHGMVVASLFFEPSTRTRLSFESAALRVGASVIGTENATVFSSISKGESLEDMIKVVSSYVDCIVMRHNVQGAATRAVVVSSVPIINAGCGSGQHPTQALTDLYTIYDELGQLGDLTIALVGDLKYGRTVHSLAYVMSKFEGTKIRLISPEVFSLPQDIVEHLEESGVDVQVFDELTCESLTGCDVVYQTRVQKERAPSGGSEFKGSFNITPEQMSWMPDNSILLHPLPRVNEISVEVDKDPRAAFFRQAKNGLYVRMSLLSYLLRDKVRERVMNPKFKQMCSEDWDSKMELNKIKLKG